MILHINKEPQNAGHVVTGWAAQQTCRQGIPAQLSSRQRSAAHPSTVSSSPACHQQRPASREITAACTMSWVDMLCGRGEDGVGLEGFRWGATGVVIAGQGGGRCSLISCSSTTSLQSYFPAAPHAFCKALQALPTWKRRVRRLRRKSRATWVDQGAPQRCSPCAASLPPAAASARLALEVLPSTRSTAKGRVEGREGGRLSCWGAGTAAPPAGGHSKPQHGMDCIVRMHNSPQDPPTAVIPCTAACL